ncbi:MAG: AI-2E family transporter [Patescibacteria group bacterium]
MGKVYKIEISAKTIVFTILFLVFLNLVWIVRELIFSFFIAYIVMSALNPWISFLQRKKIPRPLSTLVTFIVIFGLVGYLFFYLIPIVAKETTLLFSNLPKIIESYIPDSKSFLENDFFKTNLPNITNNTLQFLRNVLSNVIFVISTIFFSLYFLIEENALRKFFTRFFDKEGAYKALNILDNTEKRLRHWFWGQLVLMLVIGLLVYIGLTLLNVRFALPLALIAGLLEIVPIIGPIISTIPAFIIAISDSTFSGIAIIALYFVIQQAENQVIVPYIMRKAVGLNPIVTLAALIIGGRVGGFLGVLIAIPVTLFIETIVTEYIKSK